MSIPKIIHYCWFGGKPLTKSVKKCIKSWIKYCPDYEIRLHNEKDYDVSSNQYAKEAYEAGKWAFVSDVARLYFIYEEGGIYLDTDVELIKSLDNLLGKAGFMGFEDNEKVNTGLGFAAEKNSPIIKSLLKDYEKRNFYNQDGILDLTPCPVINMRTLVKMGLRPDGTEQDISGFHFYPKEYFSPKSYWTGEMTHFTENTISIHHYYASWETNRFRIKKIFRKIYRNREFAFFRNIMKRFLI